MTKLCELMEPLQHTYYIKMYIFFCELGLFSNHHGHAIRFQITMIFDINWHFHILLLCGREVIPPLPILELCVLACHV